MIIIAGIFKVIGKILYFILPVIFIVIGFFGGVLLAQEIGESNSAKWRAQKTEELTHTVVLNWWDGTVDEIKVREDAPFTVEGSKDYLPIYNDTKYNQFDTFIIDGVNVRIREGYKLQGFYTSAQGGTKVINAAGYGLVTIDEDLELWAIWVEV